MEEALGVYWIGGVWSIVMLAVFIWAIRICYRIEARSPALRNRSGLPRNANPVPVIFNWGVAPDEETQRLRRKMNWLFLVVVAGFLAMGLAIAWAGEG